MVVTKSIVHHFAANSDSEMSDWIAAFQSVAFKDNVSRQTIEEDNELYCSSGDAGVFSVRLVASEASERCGLTPGPYTLVLTPSALQLRDSSEQSILYTWPYKFIRRYGKSAGKFTFEAGRKCESGEGIFHMEHSNHQEIFRCISTKMNYMKKILIGETIPPSPAIVCGDNQFNAALSMTARSRSPLPPSPTSATSPILDSELCAISSVKPMMSALCDSYERIPSPRSSHGIILKPKPKKPPRKFPPLSTKPTSPQTQLLCNGSLPKTLSQTSTINSISTKSVPRLSSSIGTISKSLPHTSASSGSLFKPVLPTPPASDATYVNVIRTGGDYDDDNSDSQAYDDVEVRSEAWRTMGVDVTSHTERPFSLMQNHETDLRRQQESGKIFIQPQSTFNDYDKLQHFGPISKSNSSSGYKQINAIATVTSAPVFNELVDDIQPARKADDSHLGYGIIRKKAVSAVNNAIEPKHTLHNELEYAVICKPNRV
ncbi:docking protein homolog isoform X2 [Lycorma delicatula]